jgi:hypothetical protein
MSAKLDTKDSFKKFICHKESHFNYFKLKKNPQRQNLICFLNNLRLWFHVESLIMDKKYLLIYADDDKV